MSYCSCVQKERERLCLSPSTFPSEIKFMLSATDRSIISLTDTWTLNNNTSYQNFIPEKISQSPCDPYAASVTRNWRIWNTEFSSLKTSPCSFLPLNTAFLPSSQTWPPMVKSETPNSLLPLSYLNLCRRYTSLNENTEVTSQTKHKQMHTEINSLRGNFRNEH